MANGGGYGDRVAHSAYGRGVVRAHRGVEHAAVKFDRQSGMRRVRKCDLEVVARAH